MKNQSIIKHALLTSAVCLSISACGGGGSSSNVEANVTQECINQVRNRLFNQCDFTVNARFVRGNVTNISNNVAPGQVLFDLLPNEPLDSFQFILCRDPSAPNNSATGCS